MKENIIGSMDAFDQWLSRLIRFRTVTAGETIVRLNATEETEIPYPILYKTSLTFAGRFLTLTRGLKDNSG
jgi:hypothetical protein